MTDDDDKSFDAGLAAFNKDGKFLGARDVTLYENSVEAAFAACRPFWDDGLSVWKVEIVGQRRRYTFTVEMVDDGDAAELEFVGGLLKNPRKV